MAYLQIEKKLTRIDVESHDYFGPRRNKTFLVFSSLNKKLEGE